MSRHFSLSSVLLRMGLGLVLVMGSGAFLSVDLGSGIQALPGLEETETKSSYDLGAAPALTLRLVGDRTLLKLAALAPQETQAVRLRAVHRVINPLTTEVSQTPSGLTVQASVGVEAPGTLLGLHLQPSGLQHGLSGWATARVPLTVETSTTSGDQALNLQGLRLRRLRALSESGNLNLQLPEQAGESLRGYTGSGELTLRALAGTRLPDAEMQTVSGDLSFQLERAWVRRLDLRTESGTLEGRLPRSEQTTLTTESGDVDLQVPPGASGTLDITTRSGQVRLRVPRQLPFRLRLSEEAGARLTVPDGLVQAGRLIRTPDAAAGSLDILVQLGAGALEIEYTGEEND
ncbi:DUF4097 family beta strand repeat-containing protein [Deinococcus lacus]|uniref:DUF4097 family beta strand repeat-containing protein n=1 Tax=Deinococcus lacus TaxID=392561 RepID=A0ABW1YDZ3_9DEIO